MSSNQKFSFVFVAAFLMWLCVLPISQSFAIGADFFRKTTTVKNTNCDASLDLNKPWDINSCVSKGIEYQDFEMEIEYNTLGLGAAAEAVGIDEFKKSRWIRIGKCKSMNGLMFCVEREGDKACAYGYPAIKLEVGGGHCKPLPAPPATLKPPIWSDLISPVCTEYDTSASQFYLRNPDGTFSSSKGSFTGVVVECIEETMLNIFLRGSGDLEVDDTTGYLEIQNAGTDGEGVTFFQLVQLNIKNIITLVLVLYVMIYGFKILFLRQLPPKQEVAWFFIRFAIVIFFTIGPGMVILYPKLLDSSKALSLIMMQTGLGTAEDSQMQNEVTGGVTNARSNLELTAQEKKALQDSYNNDMLNQQAAENDANQARQDTKAADDALRALEAQLAAALGPYNAARREADDAKDAANDARQGATNVQQEKLWAEQQLDGIEKEIDDAVAALDKAMKEADETADAAAKATEGLADLLADYEEKLAKVGKLTPEEYELSRRSIADVEAKVQAARQALADAQAQHDNVSDAVEQAPQDLQQWDDDWRERWQNIPDKNDYCQMMDITWGLFGSRVDFQPPYCKQSWDEFRTELDGTGSYGTFYSDLIADPAKLEQWWNDTPGEIKPYHQWMYDVMKQRQDVERGTVVISGDLGAIQQAIDDAIAALAAAEKELADTKAAHEAANIVAAAQSAADAAGMVADAAKQTAAAAKAANDIAQERRDQAAERLLHLRETEALAKKVLAEADARLQGLLEAAAAADAKAAAAQAVVDGLEDEVNRLRGLRDKAFLDHQDAVKRSAELDQLAAQARKKANESRNALDGGKQALEDAKGGVLDAERKMADMGLTGSGYNYCDFRQATYPEGKEYMQLWDMIDCKISKYLGMGEQYHSLVPKSILIIMTALFSGPYGLFILILGLVFLRYMIAVTVKIVMVYVMAIVATTILVYLSPLLIPAVLFNFTKRIYQYWLRQMISFLLQPVILFAFLAMIFAVFDSIVYGGNHYFDRYNQIVADPQTGTCPDPDTMGCIYQAISVQHSTQAAEQYGEDWENVDQGDVESTTIRSVKLLARTPEVLGLSLPIWSSGFEGFTGNGLTILVELLKLLVVCFIVHQIIGIVEQMAQRLTDGTTSLAGMVPAGGALSQTPYSSLKSTADTLTSGKYNPLAQPRRLAKSVRDKVKRTSQNKGLTGK